MWAGLSLAVLVSSSLFIASSGQATDPFEASNVQAFIDQQFLHLFTDCDAFVDTFTAEFDFHDIVRISDSKEELREFCLLNEGVKVQPHTGLSITPGSFSSPTYRHLAYTAQQSACLDIGDGNGLQSFCFKFFVAQKLKGRKTAPFGLKTERWTGYFNPPLGSCPGFEPLDCSDGAR